MIVDDSAIVRQTLTEIFESESELKVIATASDPIIAAKKLQDEVPDVMFIDIEMPRMDVLPFLRRSWPSSRFPW
jgi:two-component system chemotaxis response regulator CheB